MADDECFMRGCRETATRSVQVFEGNAVDVGPTITVEVKSATISVRVCERHSDEDARQAYASGWRNDEG